MKRKRPNDAIGSVAPSSSSSSSSSSRGSRCVICFDPFAAYGSEHCVAALKCGHVFGLSCAERAVKARKICPTCRLPARKSDIRKIYWRYVCVCVCVCVYRSRPCALTAPSPSSLALHSSSTTRVVNNERDYNRELVEGTERSRKKRHLPAFVSQHSHLTPPQQASNSTTAPENS